MKNVHKKVEEVKNEFREIIIQSEISNKGLSLDQYTRYLQMQYHLVKDVQQQFYKIAGHSDIYKKAKFREFILEFGTIEGPHYIMAKKDLENLNKDVGSSPLDVKLWRTYFDKLIETKPLMRLGGTCILENVGTAASDLIDIAISKSSFLTKKNTTFLILHKHEVLDHGAEILEAISSANLSTKELEDVMAGIEESKTMFFRMFHWVFTGENS